MDSSGMGGSDRLGGAHAQHRHLWLGSMLCFQREFLVADADPITFVQFGAGIDSLSEYTDSVG